MKVQVLCILFDLEQFNGASDKNFRPVNLNFHRISHNKQALTQSKSNLEMDEVMKTRKKLISAQVNQPFLNKGTIFKDKLLELLDKVKTPPALHFVQTLSANPEHCSAFVYYRNSHFHFFWFYTS